MFATFNFQNINIKNSFFNRTISKIILWQFYQKVVFCSFRFFRLFKLFAKISFFIIQIIVQINYFFDIFEFYKLHVDVFYSNLRINIKYSIDDVIDHNNNRYFIYWKMIVFVRHIKKFNRQYKFDFFFDWFTNVFKTKSIDDTTIHWWNVW